MEAMERQLEAWCRDEQRVVRLWCDKDGVFWCELIDYSARPARSGRTVSSGISPSSAVRRLVEQRSPAREQE